MTSNIAELIEHMRKLRNLSVRLVSNDDAAIAWTAARALESAQREIGGLREALEVINRRASPAPERTLGDCADELMRITDIARAALNKERS